MMRITTRMLDETAKKTGIPINRSSLLNYMDKSKSSSSTLLDALNKNNKVSSASAESYKKLEQSAENLKSAADKLAAGGEQSLFEQAKASGDNEKLYSGVKSFVDNYNSVLSDLRKNASPLNTYYSQMLREAADGNSGALENIGITVGRDGKLSIDSEKMKAASVDDIEKIFGASSSFASKTSFIAGKISSNAQANLQSVSSQYNSNGDLYAQLASKFDFWS